MKINDLTLEFTNAIKQRILKEEYKIGESIPTHRELALEFAVSRSVVNVGIAKLEAQGYLTIRKRQSTIVNNYLIKGSLDVIKDMTLCDNKELRNKAIGDILSARLLVETESAKCAAENANQDYINELESIIEQEKQYITNGIKDYKLLADIDLKFHKQIIKMSENTVYILLMNVMEDMAREMTRAFYKEDAAYFEKYVEAHEKIAQAIREKEKKKAIVLLKEILLHGEKLYKLHN